MKNTIVLTTKDFDAVFNSLLSKQSNAEHSGVEDVSVSIRTNHNRRLMTEAFGHVMTEWCDYSHHDIFNRRNVDVRIDDLDRLYNIHEEMEIYCSENNETIVNVELIHSKPEFGQSKLIGIIYYTESNEWQWEHKYKI